MTMTTLFDGLTSYRDYLQTHPFHLKLGVDIDACGGGLESKQEKSAYYSVDPSLNEALPAEMDDLVRLHYLVTSRRVTTILEFGVGKSTLVFDDALEHNKRNYQARVSEKLRRSNPFECHSTDNNEKWIDEVSGQSETSNITYHYTPCCVSSFNGRICTYFEDMPNICPDFIYLDGPDQFSPEGHVRGITTKHPDRLPMSADILAIEHFLLPGTLIVVDGRTANARFLKTNLQRDWSYEHLEEFDQHIFELVETPLGVFNKRQIDFCLGEAFYSRLKR